MQDGQFPEAVEKGWKIVWIIWGAMIVALVIYLVVGIVMSGQELISMGPGFPIMILRTILYIFSLMGIGIAIFLRSKVLKGNVGGAAGTTQSESPSPGQQHPVIARYITAMVISLAFGESIGIYGLLLSFIGNDIRDLYFLITLSAAVMFYFRPKRDEVMKMLTTTG